MLKLAGRLAVVVGGGPVAMRKAAALKDAGAVVRMVCPAPSPEAMNTYDVISTTYQPEHLCGATIVFACTDDAKRNAQIVADARLAGALANAVDQPADCDFFSPAVLRDGDVLLAIGTGGAAPGLAAWLKEQLADALPPRIGEFADTLTAIRDSLHAACPDGEKRMRIMRQLACQDGYDTFLRAGPAGLDNLLQRLQAGEA